MEEQRRPAAIVYHRISRSVFGDSDDAIRRQIEDTTRMAENRGLEIVASFTDSDETAWAGSHKRRKGIKRPGLAALEVFVRDHRPAYVVAWKDDRLFRDVRRRLDFNEVCREAGTRILTYDGEMDPAVADHRFVATIKTAVAEKSSDDTQQRVLRALADRAAYGFAPGGPPGFGYRRHDVTDGRGRVLHKTYVIDEVEAELIRRAAAEVLAGRSLHAVAREWNAAGVPSAKGYKGTWNSNTVRNVLTSPRVIGQRTYQGKAAGAADWPAILDEATQRRLLMLVDARRGYRPGPRRLLSGLLVCGREGCGGRLESSVSRHGRRSYRCSACARVSIDGAAAEGWVVREVLDALDRPALAKTRSRSTDAEVAALVEEAQGYEAELVALADHARAGMRLALVVAAQEGIENRLAVARRRLDAMVSASPGARFAGQGAELRQRWDLTPAAEQRRILEALVEHVEVLPGRPGARLTDENLMKRLRIQHRDR